MFVLLMRNSGSQHEVEREHTLTPEIVEGDKFLTRGVPTFSQDGV